MLGFGLFVAGLFIGAFMMSAMAVGSNADDAMDTQALVSRMYTDGYDEGYTAGYEDGSSQSS